MTPVAEESTTPPRQKTSPIQAETVKVATAAAKPVIPGNPGNPLAALKNPLSSLFNTVNSELNAFNESTKQRGEQPRQQEPQQVQPKTSSPTISATAANASNNNGTASGQQQQQQQAKAAGAQPQQQQQQLQPAASNQTNVQPGFNSPTKRASAYNIARSKNFEIGNYFGSYLIRPFQRSNRDTIIIEIIIYNKSYFGDNYISYFIRRVDLYFSSTQK